MSGTDLTHTASPTPLNNNLPLPPKSPKDQTKSLSLVVHFFYFSPLFLSFLKKAVHSQEAKLFSLKKGILKQQSLLSILNAGLLPFLIFSSTSNYMENLLPCQSQHTTQPF